MKAFESEPIASLPRWLQRVVSATEASRRNVAEHEALRRMREGTLTPSEHRYILIGFWPLIERFPQFLALNLLKTSYGSDPALDGARAWLSKNLRVEQKHAEWFLDWSDGCGISREEIVHGWRPVEMTVITDWCWRVCESGSLAEAMVATNFAIEGVTGLWAPGVASSPAYRATVAGSDPERAMRWLDAHAAYDDQHPWEALSIVGQLVGPDPGPVEVRAIEHAALKSYELYRLGLDTALKYGKRNQTHAQAPEESLRATQ